MDRSFDIPSVGLGLRVIQVFYWANGSRVLILKLDTAPTWYVAGESKGCGRTGAVGGAGDMPLLTLNTGSALLGLYWKVLLGPNVDRKSQKQSSHFRLNYIVVGIKPRRADRPYG